MAKKSNNFARFILALLVAAAAVAVIYYIGWFNNRTHVDTPAGDNVEATYQVADPESPAESQWENASHESLDQIITEGTQTSAQEQE